MHDESSTEPSEPVRPIAPPYAVCPESPSETARLLSKVLSAIKTIEPAGGLYTYIAPPATVLEEELTVLLRKAHESTLNLLE